MLKGVVTRFRAYQLGCPGSSFSYFAGGHFTVIEGRLTDVNRRTLMHEMDICGVEYADALDITSWDSDHFNKHELQELLELIRPAEIECPGYNPYSDHGEGCLEIIADYQSRRAPRNRIPEIEHITPKYIEALDKASAVAYRNTYYNPKHIDEECANNNSTVKHLRKGSFNVLSLGDVECSMISARLRRARILRSETDVMILAHHGADNGFTTKPFLSHLEPSLAVCSSNYDNQYDHPRDEVKELLWRQGIALMTTKTGDVVVRSIGDHTGEFLAVNLKSDSEEVSSTKRYVSKKRRLLNMNNDTLRQRYYGRRSFPR